MSSQSSTVIDWTHDKIVTLVYHMRTTGRNVDDIVYAVEKPWKFMDEYEEALRAIEDENDG